MNNLRATIDTLFRKVNPDWLLEQMSDKKKGLYLTQSIWNIDRIQYKLLDTLDGYSHNDIENVWQKINEDWAVDPDSKIEKPELSLFALVNHFAKEVLVIEKQEPVVDFEDLLRWRGISHLLGEDLFTCNFLAWSDIMSRHQRTHFGWRPVIPTNNIRLRNLLEKGVAENHFHLQGSAPHTDISWIALMNKVSNRKTQFNKFLRKGRLIDDTSSQGDLYHWILKAAYIRLLLFNTLNNVDEESGLFDKASQNHFLYEGKASDKQIIHRIPDLQRKINSFRQVYGKKLDPNLKFNRPDYCIQNNFEASNFNGNGLLTGERWFLYEMYRKIKLGDKAITPFQDLFYVYLVIKAKFREEMIQLNQRVGFKNFSLYQKRKMAFLEDKDIYRNAIYSMAIKTSNKNQNIKSFETRIKPESTKTGIIEYSNSINRAVERGDHTKVDVFLEKYSDDKNTQPHNFFYVHHFIKSRDKQKHKSTIEKAKSQMICRHNQLRKEIKQQAQAIAQVHSGMNELGQQIAGIDAASSEADSRPEVFAQAYRFLKNYRDHGKYDRLTERELNPLRATFHAGEDFFDLVDGLRAIDEAIKFCNLGEGDRIGHALALGVNPKGYYHSKSRTIMLPKQWHLDNIAWLLSRINKYRLNQFATLAGYLRWEFQTLFTEIYESFQSAIHNIKDNYDMGITPELYYEAWKLRGDNPDYYNEYGKCKLENHITFWDSSGINHSYPRDGVKRKTTKINLLYHHYHFNPKVKRIGNEIKRVEIKHDYIQLVTEIQKCFQLEIAQLHLGIETNPSSNVLIGTFKRYDKHPIINFFNLGLETDPEKIQTCPQLFVSINTDDQGVFNTYLENEYALMALALEKMEDEYGNKLYKPAMIYDWLDRIRQMGLEMSFKK